MNPTKGTHETAKHATMATKQSKGFTDEERAVMKERAQALKRGDKTNGESDVLAKIARMPEPDRDMAQRIHVITKDSAPAISPRIWYEMPAYTKDGKVVYFCQSANKFKTRYATFGFSAEANSTRMPCGRSPLR
jgi:hypothetical protein